jgi:hypothetical protein
LVCTFGPPDTRRVGCSWRFGGAQTGAQQREFGTRKTAQSTCADPTGVEIEQGWRGARRTCERNVGGIPVFRSAGIKVGWWIHQFRAVYGFRSSLNSGRPVNYSSDSVCGHENRTVRLGKSATDARWRATTALYAAWNATAPLRDVGHTLAMPNTNDTAALGVPGSLSSAPTGHLAPCPPPPSIDAVP